ncbi:hypothetical protein Tco_1538074 [Tanacetum coccineum]
MLDVALVPINEQVKILASNYRISLEKIQPDVIYKVCLEFFKQYSFYNALIATEDALEIYKQEFWITLKDHDQPFTPPASEKEIIRFINELGCLNLIKIVSALRVNDLYQPW